MPMFDDGPMTSGSKEPVDKFVRDTLVKLRLKMSGIILVASIVGFGFGVGFGSFLAAFFISLIMALFLTMMSLMVNANEPVGILMENLSRRPWILWKPAMVDHRSMSRERCEEFLENLKETDYLRFTSELHLFRRSHDAVVFKLSLE